MERHDCVARTLSRGDDISVVSIPPRFVVVAVTSCPHDANESFASLPADPNQTTRDMLGVDYKISIYRIPDLK